MATLREIAKKVGVSTATVSRVLNYDETLSIGAQKRQMIFEVAEALEYQSPRQKRSGVPSKIEGLIAGTRIGLMHFICIEEELEDPYYISIRVGIEKKCRELGIDIVRIFKEEDEFRAAQFKDIRGIVAIGKFSRKDIRNVKQWCRDIVVVDASPLEEEVDSVVVEVDKTMKKILDFAFKNGFEKIGFFGGVETYADYKTYLGEKRMTAYVEYMKEKGLYDEKYLVIDTFGVKNGYNMFKTAYEEDRVPELIIAGNDSVALGAMRAIHEVGLDIPGDVSVIGINDIPTAHYSHPPLTTVKLYSEFMGETAVELLTERVVTGRTIPKKVVVPTKLMIRDSCRIASDK